MFRSNQFHLVHNFGPQTVWAIVLSFIIVLLYLSAQHESVLLAQLISTPSFLFQLVLTVHSSVAQIKHPPTASF